MGSPGSSGARTTILAARRRPWRGVELEHRGGAVDDPTNPEAISRSPTRRNRSTTTIDVSSSNAAVLAEAGISPWARRDAIHPRASWTRTAVTVRPTQRAFHFVFSATRFPAAPTPRAATTTKSATRPRPSTGDDHMLVNDETNTIFPHEQHVSGYPVKT